MGARHFGHVFCNMSGFPQLLQNSGVPITGTWQWGQRRCVGMGAPQFTQNLVVVGTSAPHLGHFAIDGFPGLPVCMQLTDIFV